MNKYLAIDIGGSFVKYSQVDHAGNLAGSHKVKTPNNLADLTVIIENLIADMGSNIRGVAISCPGRIDDLTGTVYNGGALPFLHEFCVKQFVASISQVPCVVMNDGKAAALSELWLGNLKGIENGAAILLGTGVGGGIILNGEIIQGRHFQAGELSFMPDRIGRPGQEAYFGHSASAVGFVRQAASLLGLADLDDGLTVFDVICKQSNQEVCLLFEAYCQKIVHIILDLQAILDLDRVVIGGGISAQPIVIETISKQYHLIRNRSQIMADSLEPIEIMACQFGNEANLLGAIYRLLIEMDR
ncbi:ROK family protein [Lactococcus carnosus]|uniref:ROK family protein n=1 Tax=Pseudolactococcus carnosus TaxID=2749961 RepID=UPI001FBBB03B|nr:ROK family protein [Lactococcus carnosus]MBR2541882.1 ROK family protein [Lactococcus sp.]MCJ1968404.1 ROK family protein [Lactococcus carnosus]